MANEITSSRILCSILLMFFPVYSLGFYILYLICGFSDMIDGTVARKTNSASEFGSRLDTVADSMFVVVCLIKLLPEMNLSIWLWIWIAVIAVIKIFNVIAGFIYKKQLVAEHTIMNKITGFLLFCYPLTIFLIEINYSAILICTIATFAAVQEGYIVCKSC